MGSLMMNRDRIMPWWIVRQLQMRKMLSIMMILDSLMISIHPMNLHITLNEIDLEEGTWIIRAINKRYRISW